MTPTAVYEMTIDAGCKSQHRRASTLETYPRSKLSVYPAGTDERGDSYLDSALPVPIINPVPIAAPIAIRFVSRVSAR